MEEMKAKAFEAKDLYRMNLISRNEAKELIMPYINAFNSKSAEIAKKYNMRAKIISFAEFVR